MSPSASEAFARAGRGEHVIGWKLDVDQRRQLLDKFPPKFRNTVADHVTLAAKAGRDAPLPNETDGEIMPSVARASSSFYALPDAALRHDQICDETYILAT